MAKPVAVIKTLEDSPVWVDRHLIFHYLRTNYQVWEPPLEIRIGAMNPALSAWLDGAGVDRFAYLTAYNPGSVVLPEAANRRRNALLRARLNAAGAAVYPGAGVGADGVWPPEPSFLATGLGAEAAVDLARVFEQHALVYWQRPGPPELWWVSVPLGLV